MAKGWALCRGSEGRRVRNRKGKRTRVGEQGESLEKSVENL